MKASSILIICTHGTYGRDDDLYGALLASNASLAKGLKVALIFIEDGVFTCIKNQNPIKIGLPNNINELQDFLELGGTLLVDENSLKERGIKKTELINGTETHSFNNLEELIKKYDISLTF